MESDDQGRTAKIVLPAKSGFTVAAEHSCPGQAVTGTVGERQPLDVDCRGRWSESRRWRQGGVYRAVVGRGCLCLTEDGSELREYSR